jgi:hypothetical protein
MKLVTCDYCGTKLLKSERVYIYEKLNFCNRECYLNHNRLIGLLDVLHRFVTSTEDFSGDCALKCPTCKLTSKIKFWRVSTVPCDDCGEHDVIECPLCEEKIDPSYGLYGEELEIKDG